MNKNEKLLEDLEAWMVRYGVSDSPFGVLSIGDGHLI